MTRGFGPCLIALLVAACTRLGYGDRPLTIDDAATDIPAAADGRGDLPVEPDAIAADAVAPDAAGPDAGPGLSGLRGAVLFEEHFDDGDFAKRGWYDGQTGTLTTSDPAPGSSSALQCLFDDAAEQRCKGGAPGRHLFGPTESVYLGYWVKYGGGFTTAIELFLHTDVDGDYVGPASSRLSLSLSTADDGRVYFRLEDNENVDVACVKLTDGTVIGCAGDAFDAYPFGEARSVCACNGLLGDLDAYDCFQVSRDRYFSRRYWYSSAPVLRHDTRSQWQRVEVYVQMNSIAGGVGVPDGRLYYAVDGEVLIALDRILFRTGEHPTMRWSHIMLAPVYGADGTQLWLDELTVARGR